MNGNGKTRVRIPVATVDAVVHCPGCNVLAPIVQGKLHCASCDRVHTPHPALTSDGGSQFVSWSLDVGRMQHGHA